MNIAIVDDIKDEITTLLGFIEKYCVDRYISYNAEQFESGEDFISCFKPETYDIIFLDIYLGGISGMKVAEKIRETDASCIIIFTTTSPDFAIKSFRVRAFDYLLKPFKYEQYEETMDLCCNQLNNKSRYIVIKESRLMFKIHLDDIIYTDYSNHYILIHMKTRIAKSYMKFGDFSKLLLPYPQFLYCYRNCIVNMDYIDYMDKEDFVLQNGERLPIARLYKQEIRQAYADYEFKKLHGNA